MCTDVGFVLVDVSSDADMNMKNIQIKSIFRGQSIHTVDFCCNFRCDFLILMGAKVPIN